MLGLSLILSFEQKTSSGGMLKTVIQQGRRREITGSVPSGYVEDYFDPRTKLGIVFSIPQGVVNKMCCERQKEVS